MCVWAREVVSGGKSGKKALSFRCFLGRRREALGTLGYGLCESLEADGERFIFVRSALFFERGIRFSFS